MHEPQVAPYSTTPPNNRRLFLDFYEPSSRSPSFRIGEWLLLPSMLIRERTSPETIGSMFSEDSQNVGEDNSSNDGTIPNSWASGDFTSSRKNSRLIRFTTSAAIRMKTTKQRTMMPQEIIQKELVQKVKPITQQKPRFSTRKNTISTPVSTQLLLELP